MGSRVGLGVRARSRIDLNGPHLKESHQRILAPSEGALLHGESRCHVSVVQRELWMSRREARRVARVPGARALGAISANMRIPRRTS